MSDEIGAGKLYSGKCYGKIKKNRLEENYGEETMGCYVISVSVGTGCYRHIQISKDATLRGLHEAILKAFDFEDDHAHVFFMDNRYWSKGEAYFSKEIIPGVPDSGSLKLRDLGLEKGKQFKYLFDVGNEWRFQCKVLRENDDYLTIPFVVRRVGESPEQYPEDMLDEEIENLYQMIDLPKETVDTVRNYFIAARRLYGAIPLFELLQIYNSQNLPIDPDRFIALATIFDCEDHFFGLIGPENFDEELESDPSLWYVAADYLLEDEADGFFELLEGQKGKSYKVLPKEEFLKYTDEDYFPLTSESLAMREYLRSHGDLRRPDDSWIGVQTMIQIDFSVQSVLSDLENEGYVAKNLKDMQRFMDLFRALNNHTRKQINCGHTPAELYATQNGKKRSNKPMTPSLNGPCPCGSGKKYKRCCGKKRK